MSQSLQKTNNKPYHFIRSYIIVCSLLNEKLNTIFILLKMLYHEDIKHQNHNIVGCRRTEMLWLPRSRKLKACWMPLQLAQKFENVFDGTAKLITFSLHWYKFPSPYYKLLLNHVLERMEFLIPSHYYKLLNHTREWIEFIILSLLLIVD